MLNYALGTAERAASGFTHKFVITFEDLNDAAIADASTGAIQLLPYALGTAIQAVAVLLTTAFSGGSGTGLTLSLGYNGDTADDDDAFLRAKEVNAAGTEILGSTGDGAAFGEVDETPTGSILTGFLALESGWLEATFAPTGEATTGLTAGEVHIFVKASDLTKL